MARTNKSRGIQEKVRAEESATQQVVRRDESQPARGTDPGKRASDRPFAVRLATLMLVGYLLATVPQTILDPLLTTHLAFGARHYPKALPVIAIGSITCLLGTYLSLHRTREYRQVLGLIPFVGVGLLSIPFFRPEMPHMNLVFVSVVWAAIASITIWIHFTPLIDPSTSTPKPSAAASLAYVNDQTAIWKSFALGLVAAFLAVVVVWTRETHAFNATILSSKSPEGARQLVLLDVYSNCQIATISAFAFIGPVYESATKALAASHLYLRLGTSE